MNEAYTAAIKEAFAIAPATKVIYHTLEVRQTGVQSPIYLVRARREWVADDENGDERTFQPCGFNFTLPPANEEGFQSLNVSIDNISREASDFIKTALTEEVPVEIIYRPYLSDDTSGPQMDPPLVLFLKDIQITDLQVTGRATFMDIVNKKFPSDIYTREVFPSLG